MMDGALELTATDLYSGVRHILYSLDGGITWQEYAEPLVLENETVVHFRAEDVAGNVEEEKTVRISK